MDTQPEAQHVTIERYRRMKNIVILLAIITAFLVGCLIMVIDEYQRMDDQLRDIKSRHIEERLRYDAHAL